MLNRRQIFRGAAAATAALATASLPGLAFAQHAISADKIERSLRVAPKMLVPLNKRIKRKELRHRKDLRIVAPSIDIHAINFEFGSDRIPREQRWKVREVARAMRRMLRRNPYEVFLIEGHTDAVSSHRFNQSLSERRAASLKRMLVRRFRVNPYALETVGFGEEQLLIPTPYEEWRNRRVTLRRVTDFVTG
jgi:outer membrane protein OmpA-like peptidoglycan-associated protein